MTNKAYELALADVGVREFPGATHNPKVLAYFADAGFPGVRDDETAWCAAAMGAWLKRAGYRPSGKLTARSYLDWGEPVDIADARPGDILIIPRGDSSWQGHVTFIHRDLGAFFECVGGNQTNAVTKQKYPKTPKKRILGIRRVTDDMLIQKPKKPLKKPIAAVAVGGGLLATASFWDTIKNLFN